MTTERQIEANRRNAIRSTGPKSPEGKARSRANATRHGLAGVLPEVDADTSAEFLERRSKWANGQEPADEAGRWALDRAVAATFRIERCERGFEGAVALDRRRARLAWDQDRALEAEEVAAKLSKEPALASRRLQASRAGVEWLIEAWFALLEALEGGGDWSDEQAARALDLLGVGADRRDGTNPIGAPGVLAGSRLELAREELERLEALRDEAMAPLEEMERDQAMAGDRAMFSKPARLILRYERDAWRRYREAMRQASAAAAAPSPAPANLPTALRLPPAPAVVARPAPPAPSRTMEEERRALAEEVAACGFAIPAWSGPLPEDDDSAYLDELERRIEARSSIPTAFVPLAVGGRSADRPLA